MAAYDYLVKTKTKASRKAAPGPKEVKRSLLRLRKVVPQKKLPKWVYLDRREWAAIEQLGSHYECDYGDVVRLAVRDYLGIG